jgi:glycosyltransferase involved in cell wall biosynthesis
MNILFLWSNQFKNGGGVGSVTQKIAKELKVRGHFVNFLALTKGVNFDDDGIFQYFYDKNALENKKNKLSFLKSFLVEKNIDIVINQIGLDINSLKLINQAKLEKVKVYTFHHNCIQCLLINFNDIIIQGYSNHKFAFLFTNFLSLKILKLINKIKYCRLFNYVVNNSYKFVLLSDKYINEIKTYSNVSLKNVISIPNPSSFEIMPNLENKKENKLLYVGRVEIVQKQVNLLLDIWKMVSLNNPDWHFDIVGEGNALPYIKERVTKENIKNISIHGHCNPKPFLEKAQIFMMTSSFEGFPMVILEAQSYGVIPIAFDSFAVLTDLITNNTNGIIINSYHIDEYAGKLNNLMQNDEARKNIINGLAINLNKYHVKEVVNEWEIILNK